MEANEISGHHMKQIDANRLRIVTHTNGSLSLIIMDESLHTTNRRRRSAPNKINRNRTAVAFCTTNQTFCESLDDYPEHAIDASVDTNDQIYRAVFDRDSMIPELTDLSLRRDSNDMLDEHPMCEEITKSVYPKSGKLPDDSWAYIVNSAKYLQRVVVKECMDAPAIGKRRSNFDRNIILPFGYRTECRQMFTYTRLLAMKTMDSEPKLMYFKIPSGCKCMVTRR